jgi:hypothetical protein
VVCEAAPARSGFAGGSQIWLIDPRALLNDEKVATIYEVLGEHALGDHIEEARIKAREWFDSQAADLQEQLDEMEGF